MFIPVRSAGGGLHWNGRRLAAGLAETCEMKCRDRVTFKSHGKELDVPIEYGSLPVRLPEHPDVELRLVVVKWPRCEKPMMLLTTLRAGPGPAKASGRSSRGISRAGAWRRRSAS